MSSMQMIVAQVLGQLLAWPTLTTTVGPTDLSPLVSRTSQIHTIHPVLPIERECMIQRWFIKKVVFVVMLVAVRCRGRWSRSNKIQSGSSSSGER